MLSRRFAWVLSCFVTCFLFAPAAARADEPEVPAAQGVVTRVGSATDFDVNGTRVAIGPKTDLERPAAGMALDRTVRVDAQAPYLGQTVMVFGKTKHHQVEATKVIYFLPPAEIAVSGSAIVEEATQDGHGGWRLNADGRILEVTPAMLTRQGANHGTASVADLRPNVWVEYRGVQRGDGVVMLQTAGFADNAVSKGENKMRDKMEFDAAAVTEDDQQSGLRKFLVGTDFTRIPAYEDKALQARVNGIGEKLIPAYQKRLPDTDATKIVFRFQLVDQKWRCAVPLPSGIILVPRQTVERLTDDSQLAAVLARAVAATLEKEDYRAKGPMRTMMAGEAAATVVGLVVPGAGLVDIYIEKKKNTLITQANQRASRVAMRMMHDAGYDVRQSPEAWWMLASGGKDRRATPPWLSVYEFQELGTTWRVTLNGADGWPEQKTTASLD